MILLGHAIVGGALAATQSNPVAAFFIALASHYATDMIPHYEYDARILLTNPRSREARSAYVRVAIDGMLGVIVPLLIFAPQTVTAAVPLLAGIVGGMLPDVLWGFSKLFPRNRILAAHFRFHYRVHTFFTDKEFPRLGGTITLAICACAIWFGLRFSAL